MGIFGVLIPWTRITRRGDPRPRARGYIRPIRLARRHLVTDAAITALALAGSLVQLSDDGQWPPHLTVHGLDPVGALLLVGATAPLAAWRRDPRLTLIVTGLVSIVAASLGFGIAVPLGPTIAVYLFATCRDENGTHHRGLVAGLFLAYLAASAAALGDFPASTALHGGLAWALAWFAGERTRLRREHIADLHHRATRAERDAEHDRRLAAAEERTRIARDLHDSVGHAVNVIAIRAGAARLNHGRAPDRSLAALVAIEEVARDAAAEIDQIVSALRDDSSRAPTGLASLDALVRQHTAAGLDVTLHTHGDASGLSTAADQAAYRILQEALTNAARHGQGDAQVQVAFATNAVELTVTNVTHDERTRRAQRGYGLLGMRERVRLLGGEFDVRRDGAVFHVRASLPARPAER